MGKISRGVKRIFGGRKPPPVINTLPGSQQLANRLPPVNFAQIMNEISGDQLTLVRGTDGRIGLNFANSKNRIPVDAPIALREVNTNLPAPRQIRGRNITEEAAAVIVLTQAMRQLTGTIEQMENTNPLLVEQNQGLLNSFKESQQMALDRGFDIRQQNVDIKLTRMGLSNSSTALGAAIALAREKAEAQVKANLEYTTLAQNLKQQSLENLHKRGGQIAETANIELGRFTTETANQLQLRGQDMQADLAVQNLEQQRAVEQARLELDQNRIYVGAELGRRQLQADQQNRLAAMGIDLINNTNNQSIAARSIDNNAIAQANQAQYAQYGLQRPSAGRLLALTTLSGGLGTLGESVGTSAGNIAGGYLTKKFGSEEEEKPIRGLPWKNNLNLFDR